MLLQALKVVVFLAKSFVIVYAVIKVTSITLDMMKADLFRQHCYRKQGGAQGTEFGYYWK